MRFWLRILAFPLTLLLAVVAVFIYQAYSATIRYPGQADVKVYQGAQQIDLAHQGEDDTLNTEYELAYWTNDSVEDVVSYYGRFAVELDRPNQTDYHLTYFANPSDYDKFAPAVRQEIKSLAACRTASSLQKLEGCYSTLVIDLKHSTLWGTQEGFPDWLSIYTLPAEATHTLIYQQWWTAKSY
ncbi:MAG TPA: hypothetical protein VHD90_04420 [Phototrophicaceae bacterium]|nr:hypothetical protein [Phototrophicaceae bacterium]